MPALSLGKWTGEVTVMGASDRALQVLFEGELFWIPYSQIDDDSEMYHRKQIGKTGCLIISEWLARQKGLTD
jgi:hypothetical protein